MRSEPTLLDTALDALDELGIDAGLGRPVSTADKSADAVITLQRDGKLVRYRAEIKERLTRSLIGPLALKFPEGSNNRLLVTDYVTPPLAEELRQRHIQFIDTAGNAFLDRRGLFIFVTGRRARGLHVPPKSLRVFRGTGLKVAFLLISAPELAAAPQRSIARATGIALGSVAAAMEGLRELGFIAEIRGSRRIVNRERLLEQWTEAYARQFAATLELARFSAASNDWWRHTDLASYGAQWGGETAAALLLRQLVPEQAIIYAEAPPPALLSDQRLRADPHGRVILRRRFWNAVPSPREDVVPPLLIYADLVTAGDGRSLDSAKQIRNAYLV